ncbi:MAG: hypothetical protein KBS68_02025 [Clostridiales bacterium]|nr:hypothetical protein [Candidatus Crickella merdequi]
MKVSELEDRISQFNEKLNTYKKNRGINYSISDYANDTSANSNTNKNSIEVESALDDQGVALTESGTAVRYSVESWANTKKDKLKEKLLAVVDKDGNPIYSEEEVDLE